MNIDKNNIRASFKTWWTILIAVIAFVVAGTIGYMNIMQRFDKMENIMSIIVTGCCPDDAKKWLGKEYGYCVICDKKDKQTR